MLISEQIRAARALLRWTTKELSAKSGVSLPTIHRMESAIGIPKGRIETIQKIENALVDGGVVFIDENGGGPGVRLKATPSD